MTQQGGSREHPFYWMPRWNWFGKYGQNLNTSNNGGDPMVLPIRLKKWKWKPEVSGFSLCTDRMEKITLIKLFSGKLLSTRKLCMSILTRIFLQLSNLKARAIRRF